MQKRIFTEACLKIQEHHLTTCGALYDLSSIPENTRNELLYPKWDVMDRSPQMTRLFSNHMNIFFCNIGKQLQSGIPNYGDDYKRYLPQTVNKTLFLTPEHYDELIKEIKSLNPKKSSGPDNISAKIINLCPPKNIFAENLTKIFNRAIEKCDSRSKWKWLKLLHSIKMENDMKLITTVQSVCCLYLINS